MKKFCLCLLILFITQFIFSESMLEYLNEHNSNMYLAIQNAEKTYIMSIGFTPSFLNYPQFGFEGSGFQTLVSEYEETENNLIFKVIYLWRGAEEYDDTDSRELVLYQVTLDKKKIFQLIESSNKETIYITLDYNPNFFSALDEKGTIETGDTFHTNKRTYLREKPISNSKELCVITQDCNFSLSDILLNNETSDVWLKIKYNKYDGYIPFSDLGKKWTIIKNRLREIEKRSKNAVLNDSRVRLRIKPNLNCETVTFLNKNDILKINDKSSEPFEIDGERWYWYQVETTDGKIGWVYGKYLDIKK